MMEVGRLPDLPPGAGCHIHQGGLQGHGGGTLVHTPGDKPIPAWSPPRTLLKPTRTYSPVSSNTTSYFLFLFSTWVPTPSSRGLNFEGSGTLRKPFCIQILPQKNVESLYWTHSRPLVVKLYRGDFLGTLTLARAPCAQAKKIDERNLGFFPRYLPNYCAADCSMGFMAPLFCCWIGSSAYQIG